MVAEGVKVVLNEKEISKAPGHWGNAAGRQKEGQKKTNLSQDTIEMLNVAGTHTHAHTDCGVSPQFSYPWRLVKGSPSERR